MSSDITVAHIHGLLENFSKNVYRAKDSDQGTLNNDVMEKCLSLFQLDYNTVEISNRAGELSSHYPSLIVIPENEKQKPNGLSSTIQSCSTTTSNGSLTPPLSSAASSVFGISNISVASSNASSQRTQQQTIYENSYEPNKLRDLINKARFARSRTRFPVPVILYKGKFVCRSSTLSCGPELYTRSSFNYLFNTGPGAAKQSGSDDVDLCGEDSDDAIEVNESFTDEQEDGNKSNSDWPLFDHVRSQDIRLLKTLNVGTIVDFMVEKKKVKFGLKVTSSEKVDKENRYSEFTLISLPYPGCEFFREFRDNNYSHESLVFDWSQTHVNADIGIPTDSITTQLLHINWDHYKVWDLVTITQNYLKLCLKYLQDNSSGLLIHCISGWDRTPLFVSLLRLSLWADGVIHQSLNATQILFLTLAYDWFLFGHDLPDRLTKGEDIFVFCFYALKYIQEEDFSVISHRHRSKHSSGSSSIAVIPQDNESNMENLQFDIDSRGSSISLSSGGSQQDIYQQKLSSNDMHENTNGNIANLSINQDSNSSIEILPEPPVANSNSPISKRRTSPVTVPYSSMRQRNESTSSVGSWQMVNQSGSLRSTDSNNLLLNLRSQNSNSQESNTTLVDDDIFTYNQNAVFIRRRDRLQSVRSTFYSAYCKAIGFKYKNGAELSSLGSMLGNIAERVGFSQRTQIGDKEEAE
ncbi:myotubularin-related protein 14 isoform X3 [Sitodiplosis mosellana]|uniref:myotubularin-related protein 14 isoform X3 n=1 Tax=Sitodiplosis mosellana TaxID=263140 RepID=UPI00244442E3|nr:myotubularin-related protein 14 isoform X3 [Sitodiplosis mosellana]